MRLVTKEEFQGLNFPSEVILDSDITAIIGRNGAGKTRLLQAILHAKTVAMIGTAEIPLRELKHFDRLEPSVMFGFNRLQNQEEVRKATAIFVKHRSLFALDPAQSRQNLGREVLANPFMGIASQLPDIVASVGQRLKVPVADIQPEDISDAFVGETVAQLGALNITSTMLTYWYRLDDNELNAWKNHRNGTKLGHYSQAEFETRFGPPPWLVFNEFLREVLDGRFYIKAPTKETEAIYEANLFLHDGTEIAPGSLSSGEKVLMWLCLTMYSSNTGRLSNPPKLLLLDEPDAALHPQMVQKLHVALRQIVKSFGTKIIFTTHSPTTVALMGDNQVFQISETVLSQVEKDVAISELLVGVDQVSVHYTNQRQVYVESNSDAEIYKSIFGALKERNRVTQHISLAFIPAAPKLPVTSVKDLLKAHLGVLNELKRDAFIEALNGQGNCAQVFGAVESLVGLDNQTVHGIVDWDLKTSATQHVHVLGSGLFYSMENAVLNPLTLGLYLLQCYRERVVPGEYGLIAGYSMPEIYADTTSWQAIADAVTMRIMQTQSLIYDLECEFFDGTVIRFAKTYVQRNGHDLVALAKDHHAYPFLKVHRNDAKLLMEVVKQGIVSSDLRSLPACFVRIFEEIQSTH